MTPAEELDALQEKKREIEERIRVLYANSVKAPPEEKLCPDWMAQLFGEKTRRIEYPITVRGITSGEHDVVLFDRKEVGKFVAVRPCGKEYGDKTYLGIYLGDIATGASSTFDEERGVLEVGLAFHNPAIYVPDLKQVIFGMASWWGVLKSPDDLKQISDADIQNIWYVKALKELESS